MRRRKPRVSKEGGNFKRQEKWEGKKNGMTQSRREKPRIIEEEEKVKAPARLERHENYNNDRTAEKGRKAKNCKRV